MNTAFNVKAKYNTVLISPERERDHGVYNGGGWGNGPNEEQKEKMRGNAERT